MKSCSPLSLACGCAGLALLGVAALPVLNLDRGTEGARLAVYLLLLLLAVLALAVLRVFGRTPPNRLLTALLPVGLAFFFRAMMLSYVSSDYEIFLSQWVATLRDNGGFGAIRLPIGNYNAPYLYFLAAISYLPIPDLYLIKLFSILFDVVLAWGGARLAAHLSEADSLRPLACFCALLLLPTVMLNGAYWGQCDALYGALVLHALASALERRGAASLTLLGVAFSFKLQTVFILPLWGALWLAGRVKFRHLFLFPAAYAVTCVPALLLGKPLGDILSVYVGQTQEGAGSLNYNSASIYSFLPYGASVAEAPAARAGILAAFVLVLLLLGTLFVFRRRLTDSALLSAGVVLALGVPFLLPYMHDRYFFLADVLTLVWACAMPSHLPAPALAQLASLSAYLVYFRQRYTFVLQLGGKTYTMLVESLLILAALAYACCALWLELRQTGKGKNQIVPQP